MGKIETNGMDFAMHSGKKKQNKGSRDTECPGQVLDIRESCGAVLRKCRDLWKGTGTGVKPMRLIKPHILWKRTEKWN